MHKPQELNLQLIYNEDTMLTKGRYKFVSLKNVPADYLLRIYNKKNKADINLYHYVETHLEQIRAANIQEVVPVILSCDKHAFIDEKAAAVQLALIKLDKSAHKKPVRYYKCDKCAYYHLTSHL
jgi:hypothetical protein